MTWEESFRKTLRNPKCGTFTCPVPSLWNSCCASLLCKCAGSSQEVRTISTGPWSPPLWQISNGDGAAATATCKKIPAEIRDVQIGCWILIGAVAYMWSQVPTDPWFIVLQPSANKWLCSIYEKLWNCFFFFFLATVRRREWKREFFSHVDTKTLPKPLTACWRNAHMDC